MAGQDGNTGGGNSFADFERKATDAGSDDKAKGTSSGDTPATDAEADDKAGDQDKAKADDQATGSDTVDQEDDGGKTDDKGGDDAAGDDDKADDDGDDKDRKPKKKQTAQDRINELTATARAAERREAEARERAERAERELEEARSGKSQDGSDSQGDDVDQAKDPDRPDPDAKGEDGKPKYPLGDIDPGYIHDLHRYEARKAREESEAEAEEAARTREIEEGMSRAEAEWSERAEEAKGRYDDFDEVVTKGAEAGTWKCSPLLAVGLKTSEVGPDVAYHLASNPDEADRLDALHPVEQAREFGRLEGRFLHQQESRSKDTSQSGKKQSSAPEPPDTRARGEGGKFVSSSATKDFAAFEKKAEAEGASGSR